MSLSDLIASLDPVSIGKEMHGLIADLYPVCRSITGDGLRRTLGVVREYIPLTLHEVPSGTRAFDWMVPKEWNIRDAYIQNAGGERVVDFQKSNLHVVSYSVPVNARMRLAELKPHLHTLPDRPDWIPYRTSYYQETWGFCLTHKQLLALRDDETYEVCIDSTLADGSLTYGECVLEGETPDEVLISCHTCHPSLCNDNLSGVALATFLARALGSVTRRHTYRFLFIPGTIGSIVWLSRNEERASRIRHGLVVTGVGDPGPFTYKKSRRGDAEIDRVAAYVLRQSGKSHEIQDFVPYGYDERQYCSPGFNLPVGCLTRTPFGRYPQYHTSADNLDFVRPEALGESFAMYVSVLSVLESNHAYLNTNPKCEPQLGRRGLYDAIGGHSDTKTSQMAMLWVLNLSDGEHTLLDIAGRADMPFETIRKVADILLEHDLLRPVDG